MIYGNNKVGRTCGKKAAGGDCQGVNYSTGSKQYNQVCGRIIGYQLGHIDAFNGASLSINAYYAEAPLTTTSGPLLLVLMSRLVTINAHALLETLLLKAIFPRLWARTTFVSQA